MLVPLTDGFIGSEKKEKGNEFRWIKPLEWIETTHDGTDKRFELKEVAQDCGVY